MAITYTAKAGDSLCSIAYEHGFGDCKALRAEAANSFIINRAKDPSQVKPGDVVTIPEKVEKEVDGATEQKHKFVKRGRLVSIRFVHGSPDLSVANDPTLAGLNISNYVTNRAGTPDGGAAFPGEGVRQFNADAHQDQDTFKVEVFDMRGSGLLNVELEALRPVYNAAGAVTGHQSFPTPRKLSAKAEKQGSTQRFRTCYLRLVTDDQDKAAADTQTLLVSDLFDGGDKKVEILDQLIKASYEIPSCPSSPKCVSSIEVAIGEDRRRIRMTVQILRNSPQSTGGTPIVSIADAEKRVLTWMRRLYAQASLGPKLVQNISVIDPPANLVSISNDTGLTADGTEQFRVLITAPGQPSQTIGPVSPAAGDTPEQTANALAALVAAPYSARVTLNPPTSTSLGRRSADIVITEAGGARVALFRIGARGTSQTLDIGRANANNLQSWNGTNFLVGSLQQRAVLKNFDTGDDRVDIFVVNQVTAGNRAEAMMSGHRVAPARSAINQVKNSAFMTSPTMDGTDNNPFVLGHEVGHVVAEVVHAPAAAPPNEVSMMDAAGTEVVNSVNASKRIRDGGVTIDLPAGSFNLVTRLRTEGSGMLEPW